MMTSEAIHESFANEIRAACAQENPTTLLEVLRTAESAGMLPKANNHVGLEPKVIKKILLITMTPENTSSDFESVKLILRICPDFPLDEEILGRAVATHSITLYRMLLARDPKIMNVTFHDDRETQLTYALSTAAPPEYIDFLLESGVEPNPHVDGVCSSPLCLVALSYQTEPLKLCEVLLRRGVRLQGSLGLSAAVQSQNTALVQFLLEQGADPNDNISARASHFRWCALHEAVESENSEISKLLIQFGAHCNILDDQGQTATTIAEIKGDKEVLDLLRER